MKIVNLRKIIALIAGVFVATLSAQAVPVDTFDVPQDVDFRREEHLVDAGKRILHRAVLDASILGGVRTITMTTPFMDGAAPNFRVFTGADAGSILSHSLGSSVSGITEVTWDGDSALGVNPTGLGGLNFLSDGTTSLLLRIQAFDFANGRPLRVLVRVFSDADRVSESVIDLTGPIVNTSVEIPVSSLVPVGVGGGADLGVVGAIQLVIDSSDSPSADIEVDGIDTNGSCSVPTFDQCKVCGGDNSSCSDCAGVPFGRAVEDQCGVCGGDGTSCLDCKGVTFGPDQIGTPCSTGLLGVCSEGIYAKDCQCLQLITPIEEICDSRDNDCDGLTDEDTQCRVEIEGEGCVKSSYDDPYKSIMGAGRKQDRLVRFSVTSELAWREGKLRNARALLRRSRQILRSSQVSVKSLPRVNTLFTAACQCTTSDHSQELSNLAERGQEWLRLIKEVVAQIKSVKDGGVCEGSIEGCVIRAKARAKRYRDMIVGMRRLVREELQAIKDSPEATGECPPSSEGVPS